MHDCRKIEESLTDLVFNELPEDQRKLALTEVENCEHCRAEYRSLEKTLSTFDTVSAAMTPDESYWNGYEARLRAKLAGDLRPNLWQWLLESAGVLITRPAWAMSLALLLWFALLVWAVLTQTYYQPQAPVQAEEKPATVRPGDDGKEKPREKVAQSPEGDREKETDIQQESDRRPKRDFIRQPKPKQLLAGDIHKPAKQMKSPDTQAQTASLPVVVNLEQTLAGASVVDEDTLKHFEKAQIFLRSFRNLKAGESDSAFEVADDKQRSQTLLFKNVLLRREAEAKGNRPVEQVLSDLEPLLIDIANLSDKAARDEIGAIRERLQKKEMIATLQIYSARPVIARAATD
jgi:hypothetical protein